jgi:Kelch motif
MGDQTGDPRGVASLNSAVHGSDGRIYLLNAETLSGGLVSSVYTPSSDSWATMPQMPNPADMGAAASVSGRIYYVGGFINGNQSSTSNQLHVYTIATQTWATRAAMPTARGVLAAAYAGGKIYAIGGCLDLCTNAEYYSTVERYNVSTNRWTKVAPLPVPTIELGAITGSDGRIYAIGGSTTSGLSGKEYIYTPKTNRWTTGPPMPTPRAALGVARVGKSIFAVGARRRGEVGQPLVGQPLSPEGIVQGRGGRSGSRLWC